MRHAEKNSTDYWHMDFEYQKKLRHYHDQYSDIHKYWTEISDYIVNEKKLWVTPKIKQKGLFLSLFVILNIFFNFIPNFFRIHFSFGREWKK